VLAAAAAERLEQAVDVAGRGLVAFGGLLGYRSVDRH
jgi:hypothetical protein